MRYLYIEESLGFISPTSLRHSKQILFDEQPSPELEYCLTKLVSNFYLLVNFTSHGPPILHPREYWMNYWGPGFLSVVWFGSFPTTPPPPPRTVSKLSLFITVCRRSSLLKGEEGGGVGGAKSYEGEKAWFSINHSILSDFSLNRCVLMQVFKPVASTTGKIN